jgi:hypothetical protein
LEQLTEMLAAREFNADAGSWRHAETDPVAVLRAGIVELLLAATLLPIGGRWCEIWGRTLPVKVVVYVAAIEMVLHASASACRRSVMRFFY